jgi:hypothetical protein
MVSTPAGCLRRAGCGALVWWVVALPALAQQPIETVRDPVYGEMLFEFYTQDYFSALIRTLVELQRQDHPPDPFGGRLSNHRDDAQLLLGGLSLAYGMPLAAQRTFDERCSAKRGTCWVALPINRIAGPMPNECCGAPCRRRRRARRRRAACCWHRS